MNHGRFRQLAETYGADLRRWPVDERAAAIAFMERSPTEAQAALTEALALDDALDRFVVAAPDTKLNDHIFRSAPMARAAWRRTRIWWHGAGLAGLGIAGALAGALTIAVLLPMTQPLNDEDSTYVVTSFDDISSELDR